MKADEKEYRCGVCNEIVFKNIQTSPGFACANCQIHFRRDRRGIKIVRELTIGKNGTKLHGTL
jgi:DNA-directed RNA polymerase subunit RPC12/RpoP